MALIGCLSVLRVGKKKSKKEIHSEKENIMQDSPLKSEVIVYESLQKSTKDASFKHSDQIETDANRRGSSEQNLVGVVKNDENSLQIDVSAEAAYEGGDEHDEIMSFKRDFSDLDLQALAEKDKTNSFGKEPDNRSEKDEGITSELVIQSGHVSDPGLGRTTAFWGSPMLKRSCSNIETKRPSKLLMSPTKSHSYDDLKNLPGNFLEEPQKDVLGSPASVMTSRSADKVMLKKRSSSQVLPSRSRKIWWRLFLWSHRNLHQNWSLEPHQSASIKHKSNQKDGYCSDTVDPSRRTDLKNKKVMEESEVKFRNDIWPSNQWVAFSTESSSLDRVDAWVHSLDDSPLCPIEDEYNGDEISPESATPPRFLDIGESSNKNNTRGGRHGMEDILQANNIIQSLPPFSSVAHIAGMGLKVIPAISAFSSLRSVNLSGNFIVHISPGSLPKSLHMLDLSRNKIATIEGLRELTRLRVLNLSYNRISRIGHGLSNCATIKELYLAGNKISGVEGLHRLLKLAVLDLSFNKITTAKALGQLVANYHSLVALNLLGNPIQSNIGDDQIRKAVCGLLPQLAYLNKQPIKAVRAREAATDSVAKAALGNNSWGARRRSARRVGHGSVHPPPPRNNKTKSKIRDQHFTSRK